MKPSADPTYPVRGGRLLFVALATLSQTGSSFMLTGIAVLGIFFAAAFHLSLAAMGATVSAVTLGMMAARPLWGLAADNFGPRTPQIVGTAAAALCTLSLVFINNYILFLVALFLTGGTLSSVAASGSKSVFLAFSARERGLPMGVRTTGVPAGAALAALILPPLAIAYGLHTLFYGVAAMLVVVGWSFCVVMPAGNGAGAEQKEDPKGTRLQVHQVAKPMLVGSLLVSIQYILLTFTLPYLHDVHGLSVTAAGAVLAAGEVGGIVGRAASGLLSDHLRGGRISALVLVASVTATMTLIVALLPTVPVPVYMVIWFVYGTGAIGWNSLAQLWAGERVPPRHAGVAMSLVGSANSGGASLWPPLFGLLVDWSHNFQLMWGLFSLVIVVALTLVLSEFRRQRRDERAAPAFEA